MTTTTKPLYIDFLKNKKIYNLNVGFWKKMVQKIALAENIQYSFADNEYFVNGKRFYDANPMISLNIPSQKKALRIIQEEQEGDEIDMSAWLKEKEMKEGVFFSELVISLTLTHITKELSKTLIENWLDTNIKEAEMQKIIENKLSNIEL
jgi:hypothetical protein